MSETVADALSAALETIRKLEETNQILMAELKCIKDGQAAYAIKSRLKAKFVSHEWNFASQNTGYPNKAEKAILDLSDQVKTIASTCNYAEKWQRRSNSLFYGLTDDPEKDSVKSEEKKRKLCSNKLNLSKYNMHFESMHRVGEHREGKNRPIKAKSALCKDEKDTHSSAGKLKGTEISISEDICFTARQI